MVFAITWAGPKRNAKQESPLWLTPSIHRQGTAQRSDILLSTVAAAGDAGPELLQRNGRLSAMGASMAEFAHQVRTPLASTLLYAGQLDSADPRQARIAGKIVNGLRELRRMADDMLGFAAGTRCSRERVNVTVLLQELRDELAGQLADGSSLAVSVTDPDLEVTANHDSLKGAIANLVCNADEAASGNANILLHGHRFGDRVHLCVTDDGPGIADEIRARLFEPFFTTRSNGTGLGLAVVKAVARAHDGRVDFTTSELGTSFSVQLPVVGEVSLQ